MQLSSVYRKKSEFLILILLLRKTHLLFYLDKKKKTIFPLCFPHMSGSCHPDEWSRSSITIHPRTAYRKDEDETLQRENNNGKGILFQFNAGIHPIRGTLFLVLLQYVLLGVMFTVKEPVLFVYSVPFCSRFTSRCIAILMKTITRISPFLEF